MRLLSFLIIFLFSACKKDWLLVKQDKSLAVPETLADMQALLDEDIFLNYSNFHLANLGEIGTDNWFMENEGFNSWGDFAHLRSAQNAYTYNKTIFQPNEEADYYRTPYKRIFYANAALDGLQKLEIRDGEQAAYNNVRGSALFVRSYSLFWALQYFAPPYKEASAATDLGVPLKTGADINLPTTRATVKQGYDLITENLREAIQLLPATSPYHTRPSKVSAYALLARIYLSMRQYETALKYADSSLQIRHSLMDFNTLDTIQPFPVDRTYAYEREVLYTDIITSSLISRTRVRIDTSLYASWHFDDLRRAAWSKPVAGTSYHSWNGSYEGSNYVFVGISTNEMFITRAECYARRGDMASALNDLNSLLSSRWRQGEFTPLTAANAGEALEIILLERRKELCFRGYRWTDLRRLNQEPGREKTVLHHVNNQDYRLEPNSNLYVFPFPPEVIEFSGIQQNIR